MDVEFSFFLCEGTMKAYELLGLGSVSFRLGVPFTMEFAWKDTHTKHTSIQNTNHNTLRPPPPIDLQLYATLNPPIAAASHPVCTTCPARAARSAWPTACPGLAACGKCLARPSTSSHSIGTPAPVLSPVATLQQQLRHWVRAPGASAAAAARTTGCGQHPARSDAKWIGPKAIQ